MELGYAVIVALVLVIAVLTSFNQTASAAYAVVRGKNEFQKSSALIAASDKMLAGEEPQGGEECINRIKIEGGKARVRQECVKPIE
ncbi:hypothetical protein HY993_01910 [Candidatus Micrarchaeota archaeon]|nr:hypothetical protein [Candidatus Micrarchaeota archaeon]